MIRLSNILYGDNLKMSNFSTLHEMGVPGHSSYQILSYLSRFDEVN